MTRLPVSVLAGSAMALLLFWGLALLVSPPEPEIEVLEMSLSLTSVEAPPSDQEADPELEAPMAEAVPPAPMTPPPMPEPAPIAQSSMALPEPQLPPEEVEPLELDSTLPELSEIQPEPTPEPEPEPTPEPAPQPEPEPDPRPAPSSQPVSESSTEPSELSRQSSGVESASEEPVDVGQATPTERVLPEYPSRAQRRGLEGHVDLQFVIRSDGRVDPSSIRVISSRPGNVFDTAAREAVARWRFESASGLRRARQRLEFQLR